MHALSRHVLLNLDKVVNKREKTQLISNANFQIVMKLTRREEYD